MKSKVFKFGGASVKDAAGIRNVVRIIRDYGQSEGQVVVVSAMGKTTNALEHLLHLAREQKDFSQELESLYALHTGTVSELFPSPV